VRVVPALTRQVYALWRKDAIRRTAILAAVDSFLEVARRTEEAAAAALPEIEPAKRRRGMRSV
jgi:hypothetical protein